MASETYETLCHEIYGDIGRVLQRPDEENLRFMPRGAAEKVLHQDKLLRFFKSLVTPGTTAVNQFGFIEKDLATRVNERHLHDYLAVLIFASCPSWTARRFTTRLVASNTWPVRSKTGKNICSLPAEREELEELFDDHGAANKFLMNEGIFCPVEIDKRKEVRVPENGRWRLPYLEEKCLQEGSFGKVFKVKIAKGHFYDPEGKTVNTDDMDLARKDYLISSLFEAKEEREIMKKIFTSSPWECKNILQNYGSLAFGGTYSLFMPLAICDLWVYMMENHGTAPNSISERRDIVRCAEGLAGGLNFLHNGMKTGEMEQLVCYHMDLKPSNILVFHEEVGEETRNIWKLSDFGMSRVKIRHQDKDVGDRDFNSWFMRRPKTQDPSLSATLNRRGDGTYLAPESISSSATMRTDSDIWSLGCIISVLFSYLEGGKEGVSRYSEKRIQHPDADGYDRFFLRTGIFTPVKVHPVISSWHERLVRKASRRNLCERSAIKFMLDFLENEIFKVDQSKRCSAEKVQDMLGSTFRKYEKFDDGEPDTPPTLKRLWQRFRPRVELTDDERVESWYLASDEGFKGCEISPDGAFVVYWSDMKISLYTSESLSRIEGDAIAAESEYALTQNDRFIWKSISVTPRYVIAATTGPDFHCYVFDLLGGDTVGPSLGRVYVLTLASQPEISKLAISPDSQTLACVLRARVEDRQPGYLFLAPVSQLLKIQSEQRSISSNEDIMSEGAADHQSDTPATHWWWKAALNWPAADVMQLFFSSNDHLYVVVRPELTARSRKHTIPIGHVYLKTKSLKILHVESQHLDSGSNARLFTTLAPFRQDPATCALIAREKQLYIQNMIVVCPPAPIRKEIKNYRVVKLMIGSNDLKMYALARASASSRLLLLQMTVPQSNDEDISVRELAHLPGLSADDQFTERVWDGDMEKCVLIAALVNNSKRAIYRVRLDAA
ncbi:hypothetical protein BDW59DRAFT_177472 [Aspergillus cavernicola]|uniref:Protein kinase domain-containing protein n=1 Tax=Aspergillus cavernicola TaxID=176166 RepID=A0ABR4HMR8_9EURO